MQDITITMPKYKYDALISENERLKKEIDTFKYRTYINFRIDDNKLRSVDFPGFYSNLKTDEEIPEIIKNFKSSLDKIIEDVNWLINDRNEKAIISKIQNIEFLNNTKKSFWKRIWD